VKVISVPGQKYFLVPLSLCPGTRAGAKIQDKITYQKIGKGHSKTGKEVLKQEKYDQK
jgi:hypothetical protein